MLYRLARLEDAPTIWRLLDDHKASYLKDCDTVTRQTAMEIALSGMAWVFADCSDLVYGVVWFDNVFTSPIRGPIHCEAHILLDHSPALRNVLRPGGLLEQVTSEAFVVIGVRKFKGFPDHKQKTAIKILQRLKFKQCGLCKRDAERNGKLVDLYVFELHRPYWEAYVNAKRQPQNVDHHQQTASVKLLQSAGELQQQEQDLRQPAIRLVQADDGPGEQQDRQLGGQCEHQYADQPDTGELLQQPGLREYEPIIKRTDYPAAPAKSKRPDKQLKRKRTNRK